MNIDVSRTLIVDDSLVVCGVLPGFLRAVVRPERER
jgi:hypothetical protein